MKILTESTPLALWYEAVQEAQTNRHISLKSDVEAYLVFLLMRNIHHTCLAQKALAQPFLEAFHHPREQREQALQQIGDQCLLISGLFPARTEKRLVKIKYYIELGQQAYEFISRKNNDIFSLLAKQFVLLMDILQAFRPYRLQTLPTDISPLWSGPVGIISDQSDKK